MPKPVVSRDLGLDIGTLDDWRHLLRFSLRVRSSSSLSGVPLLAQLLSFLPTAGWWLAFALQAWILVLVGQKFVQSWLARPGLPVGQLCGSWQGGQGRPDR